MLRYRYRASFYEPRTRNDAGALSSRKEAMLCADITLDSIGDLVKYDLAAFLDAAAG